MEYQLWLDDQIKHYKQITEELEQKLRDAHQSIKSLESIIKERVEPSVEYNYSVSEKEEEKKPIDFRKKSTSDFGLNSKSTIWQSL